MPPVTAAQQLTISWHRALRLYMGAASSRLPCIPSVWVGLGRLWLALSGRVLVAVVACMHACMQPGGLATLQKAICMDSLGYSEQAQKLYKSVQVRARVRQGE